MGPDLWRLARGHFAARQAARERRIPLDSARYLAVSTGRLEPYLRGLAHTSVWVGSQPHWVAVDDGPAFVAVWTTRARAVEELCRTDGDTSVRETSVTAYLDSLGTDRHDVGVIVDPGRESELSVEPHHRDTIARLRAGHALPEALSAIASEDLVALSPSEEISAHEADPAERSALALLPRGCHLLRVDAQLTSSPAPGPVWPIYFVQGNDQGFPPLGDDLARVLEETLGPARVVVDPATPTWKRDLLWDLRAWALPVVSEA